MIILPAAKHKEFDLWTKKGKEFIKLWNGAHRDGIQNKLAHHFSISPSLVVRIRIKLKLSPLHDLKNHPGRRKFYKRVKKLYVNKGRSTLQIGKILRMNDENIRQILKKQNVKLRPQHITDVRYLPTNSYLTPTQLLKEMKRLYEDDKLSAVQIAKKLGVDHATISKRLKALGIELRQGHKKVLAGGYKCQWCAVVMRKVYQNKGPRKQLYCCSSHKNKARDYRRMLRGIKFSKTRLESFEAELREKWGDEYPQARERILSAKPAISNQKKNSKPPTFPLTNLRAKCFIS